MSTPTPEAIALAETILQRRAERAARRAPVPPPPPCAMLDGISYPLGTVLWRRGHTVPERAGVLAGVSEASPADVVVAVEWHPGAPAHRWEKAQEGKRRRLGFDVYPSWELARAAMRGAISRSLDYERKRMAECEARMAECEARLAALDALVGP